VRAPGTCRTRDEDADLLVKRLVLMLSVATAGWVVAEVSGLHDLQGSAPYLVTATALLALGLFSSTYEIDRGEIAGNVRLVLVAVTVGVLLKAALIAGVMYLAFGNPAYIVVAVAVAQIDPLSVAVTRDRSRLSPRAKAILSAWSSFDDPVTAILAVYLSMLAWSMTGRGSPAPGLTGGLDGIGTGLLLNLLFVACVGLVWLGLLATAALRGHHASDLSVPIRVTAVLILLAAGAIAVANLLVLGVAIAGLFFRPGIGRGLRLVTPVAFLLALVMLGLVLADGINLGVGAMLGAAAFGAQIIVGALLTRSLHGDRARLALSQQNGITAVILALLLETAFPGTVAIVAPAILVVGVLHLAANSVLDRIEDRAVARTTPLAVTGKQPEPLDAGGNPPAATTWETT
jgi:hypothetical protein